MNENDIRPADLMERNDRLIQEDISLLLLRESEFVTVACPACESKKHKTSFQKQGFTFVTCQECQTMHINPRPTHEMLMDYYSNSKSMKQWNDQIFPATEEVRRNEIFQPRARMVSELCRKHGVRTNTLIDVGAGSGIFCEEIQKLRLFDKVTALEPSHGLAETCRRKGLDTLEVSAEAASLRNVDVVTAFEVIGLAFCPKDFLVACKRMLNDSGILILTTPNIKGFDLRILGRLSDNIGGPNHLNYFHAASLQGLLRACGFETLQILTPGKLDADIVRSKLLANKLRREDLPFLSDILLDEWETAGKAFQVFLSENNLSSHLWVASRPVPMTIGSGTMQRTRQ